MERLTKQILIGWTCLALAAEVRLLSGSWPALALWLPAAALVSAALAAFTPRTVSVLLVMAYAVPVLARELRGGVPYSPNDVLWLGPLFGAMLPDLVRSPWRIQRTWRAGLVVGGLVVAATTPVVILREVDFIPGLLLEREAWHWVGSTYPSSFAVWALYVALTIVIGILWFDWLLGRPAERFLPDIVVPLALGAVVTAVVAGYQYFVDLSFLNPTTYASHRRATGTMFDANLSGMATAMWIGGGVALVNRPGRLRVPLVVAVLLLGWTGVWATGSRTSLGAALVVTAFVVASLARGVRIRPWHVLVAGAALVVLLVVIASGGRTVSPLARIYRMLPSPTLASVGGFARELWNRNNYGYAATVAIVRHPWFGAGVGSFHLLGSWFSGVGFLPPDNAQNWLRHQVAELGVVGSAGFLVWYLAFAVFVLRRRRTLTLEGRVLRGVLVAFGAMSMLGMPGQAPAIAMTFWVFATWFARSVDDASPATPLPRWWGAGAALVVVAAVAGTVSTGRGDLRPARRALTADWTYAYGVTEPQATGDEAGYRVGAERAAAVLERTGRWFRVTIRRRVPGREPLIVKAEVDGASVLKGQLTTVEPLSGVIDLADAGSRVILDIAADSGTGRRAPSWTVPEERYLVTWEFSDERLNAAQAVR